MAKKKLLYVQHAGALGGSCVSLMYMLRGLDRERFEPTVVLARPSAEVADYYASAGFTTIDWPELPMFDHNTGAPRPLRSPDTWRMLFDLATRGSSGVRATMRLVERTGADIVHLNSAPLAVAALALHRERFPMVWHVREHPFRIRGRDIGHFSGSCVAWRRRFHQRSRSQRLGRFQLRYRRSQLHRYRALRDTNRRRRHPCRARNQRH